MAKAEIDYDPLPFLGLPGWNADDHAAAFAAYLKSARRLMAIAGSKPTAPNHFETALALAERHGGHVPRDVAKTFFESHFCPARVVQAEAGLLTGYFEPEIKGSRVKTAAFPIPLRRRPADLVNLVDDSARAAPPDGLTHARKTPTGTEPYPTRAEIDQGALTGQNLEFVYLAGEVEKFFLQVQGSGRIVFPDGSAMRVSYDGKNGHPYTSIGRHLVDQGHIAADRMSLATLGDWLRADPDRAREVMWLNKSYVFFRELGDASAPLGVLDIPLTAGRSLAVDPRFHDLGTPIYIAAPTLPQADGTTGLARLAIAQDVGSAIKGAVRGDLFFGSGDAAGRLAGETKHPVMFYVLRPPQASGAPDTAGQP